MAPPERVVWSRREGRAVESRVAAGSECGLARTEQGNQSLRLGNTARGVARGREMGPRKSGPADESPPSVCAFAAARERRAASGRAQTRGRGQRHEPGALRDFEDAVESEARPRGRALNVMCGGPRACSIDRPFTRGPGSGRDVSGWQVPGARSTGRREPDWAMPALRGAPQSVHPDRRP